MTEPTKVTADFQPTAQDLANAKDAGPMDEPKPPFAGMVWKKNREEWFINLGEYSVTLGKIQDGRWAAQVCGQHTLIHESMAYCVEWIRGRLTDLTRALVGVVPLEDYAKAIPLHEIHAWSAKLESERDTALARAESLAAEVARKNNLYAGTLARAEKAETALGVERKQAAEESGARREREARLIRERNSLQSLLDALLATLSKALPTTPISPKNAREALELVVRERDEAKGRALERENWEALLGRASKAENERDAAIGERNEALTRSIELQYRIGTVEQLHTEAADRVRKLEAEVEHWKRERADRATADGVDINELHAQLTSVTAQRDRAWNTNEILKAQLEEMTAEAKRLVDEWTAAIENNAKEGLRTKTERPVCVPKMVTDGLWRRLSSGLVCWNEFGFLCIHVSGVTFRLNEGASHIAIRDLISPADFHAARVFMGWER